MGLPSEATGAGRRRHPAPGARCCRDAAVVPRRPHPSGGVRPGNPAFLALLLASLALVHFLSDVEHLARAYTFISSGDTTSASQVPFSPGEKGFTGYYGEPSDPQRYRVNPGNVLTFDKPMRFEGTNPRQNCPGMVGPLDGKYYCTNEMFGYCDRRTGTCFCNGGYTSLDCATCRPTHYLSFSEDKTTYTCAQKKRCPNDCSGGGDCDFSTGKCNCKIWRSGEACENAICTKYDDLCVRCDTIQCWECAEGYFVNSSRTRNVCGMCTKFDPRCLVCNEEKCLVCTDPLLRSVRRSGRRRLDPEQPFEEFYRELAITLPFGSQRPEAFDEAEPFQISSTADRPLRGSTVGCTQGRVNDRQWHCGSVMASHKVCGHVGTLGFNSPEYQVREDAGHLLVTVFRTGGGVGETSVDYAIRYSSNPDMGEVEASTADVTPTAHYTSSQTLTFAPGVVRLQFQITIHSDVDKESNETFTLGLSNPTGGATLGPQSRCIITIIDDDTYSTDPPSTVATGIGIDAELNPEAMAPNVIVIQTYTAPTLPHLPNGLIRNRTEITGLEEFAGGDVFWYEVWDSDRLPDNTGPNSGDGYINPPPGLHQVEGAELRAQMSRSPHSRVANVYGKYTTALAAGLCVDDAFVSDVSMRKPGQHTCTYTPPRSGNFSLAVRLVTPFGLVGEYFDNPFLQDQPVIQRIDAVINFTWGVGAITENGRDFVSARWHGKISTHAGHAANAGPAVYRLFVLADDHTRLWLDGTLLIDTWDCDAVRHPEMVDRITGWVDGAPRQWDQLQPCSETSGDVELTPETYHDIRIEFRELRGRASIRLMWESPDTGLKKTVVPKENLFQVRHIQGSPFAIDVQPSQETSADTTYPAGTGLLSGVAGDHFPVTIFPNDGNFNARGMYAKYDQYEVEARLAENDHMGDGPRTVASSKTDFQPDMGTFISTYRPVVAGTYYLDIELLPLTTSGANSGNGLPISGSPYKVFVHPSPAVGPTSQAYGPGLTNAVAGDDAFFKVRLRDQFQNIRRNRSDIDTGVLTAVAIHYGAEEVYSPHTKVPLDTQDATYQLIYVANKSGVVMLNIRVNGDHVLNMLGLGSPYKVVVTSTTAHAPACTAEGWALTEATSSISHTFNITVRDRFNNLRYESVDKGFVSNNNADIVTCDIRPAVSDDTNTRSLWTNATVLGTIYNYEDAVYRCEYVPRFAGLNRLEVRVAGKHISGSPFIVQVADGAAKGPNSTVLGKGFWVGSMAGYTAHFTVQSVDEHGNFRIAGPMAGNDSFAVRLTHRDPAQYYKETVKTVLGWRAGDTVGDGTNVTTIDGDCSHYLGLGRYHCTYNVSVKGPWDIAVTLGATEGGKHVSGSPREVYVQPAEVNADVSLPVSLSADPWTPYPSPAGLTRGVAGWRSYVTVQAKDRFGNNRTLGGDFFSVRLTGIGPLTIGSDTATDLVQADGTGIVPEGLVVSASDGGDSTYNGSFVPYVAGRFKLDVLLNGTEPVSDSPYSLTILPDVSNGSSSHAIGNGLVKATSAIETSFTIQARDRYGNPQVHHNDNFYVVATRGPTEGRIATPGQPVYSGEKQPQFRALHEDGTISPIANSHGQYKVKYTPTDSGVFLLRIALLLPGQKHDNYGLEAVASSMELLGSELEGSPYLVKVSDGSVDATTSHAYGVALSHSTAGEMAYFTVQARDAAGNNRTQGGDSVVVSVVSDITPVASAGGGADVAVTYLINGTYRVAYNATKAGNTTVAVTIAGQNVLGSPFRPYVSPNVASAPNCFATGAGLSSATVSAVTSDGTLAPIQNITIYARDRYDNLLDRGGDQFLVRLVGPTMLFVRLQDAGNGKYEAEYIPSFLPGVYDLTIAMLNGYMTEDGGGLKADFFTDLSMRAPRLTRIDRVVNTAIPPIYASARWTGFIVPVGTGPYHFIVRAMPEFTVLPRLTINGVLLVDAREGFAAPDGQYNHTLPMVGGVAYNVSLSAQILSQEGASIQFLWAGPGLPGIDTVPRLVPASRLAPSVQDIEGSPFKVQVQS